MDDHTTEFLDAAAKEEERENKLLRLLWRFIMDDDCDRLSLFPGSPGIEIKRVPPSRQVRFLMEVSFGGAEEDGSARAHKTVDRLEKLAWWGMLDTATAEELFGTLTECGSTSAEGHEGVPNEEREIANGLNMELGEYGDDNRYVPAPRHSLDTDPGRKAGDVSPVGSMNPSYSGQADDDEGPEVFDSFAATIGAPDEPN